ncbi:hypothetical protein GCM10009838_14600 [Catenulispora subtropica]|uniref:Uncharacterized protein n=1 Tax=Catenulispora subtropica TaxID=450798 RepID=A0ABN2QWD0_9ACTN
MSVLDHPVLGPFRRPVALPVLPLGGRSPTPGKEGNVANTRNKRQQVQGNTPWIGLATLIVKFLIEIFTN